MPDKYREILSGSSAWLAIFAAAGGVLVNYIGVYKQTGRLHLRWLLGDLVTSCFLGYFAFWLLLDWGFAVSECAVGTAIVGNLGAKVFAIIKHFLSVRTGTPPHVLLEQNYDADEGPDKGV